MLRIDNWMNIKLLEKDGFKIKEIARMTGHARNTVRKVLRNKFPSGRKRKKRASKLDPFKEHINTRYYECALSAVRLLEEIKPMGFEGSVDTIRRYIKTLKEHQCNSDKITVRFETPPGKQAQVDWGYCGKYKSSNGKNISVYFFSMVLCYSRMIFVKFTSSMKTEELIQCHLDAFEYFGGWTKVLLFDNMTQVRLISGKLNPLFVDFADHYGIAVKTHRPRSPRTKGKVERSIGYIKGSFLNGRSFIDIEDLNAQGLHWMENTANIRIHGTLGEKPTVLFPKEELTSLTNTSPYKLASRVNRKVNAESYVHFNGSRYSVSPENVGRTVTVEQNGQKIIIKAENMIIAQHEEARKSGMCVSDKKHVAELWKLTMKRSQAPKMKWNVTFKERVESRPLAIYEEVAK